MGNYLLCFAAGTFVGSLVQHIAYRLGYGRNVSKPVERVPLSEAEIIEGVRRGYLPVDMLPWIRDSRG